MGTTHLLGISMGSLLLCLVVVVILLRSHGEQLGGATEEDEGGAAPEGQEEGNMITRFLKERYDVLVIVSALFSIFAFYVLDFAFYDGAESQYPAEDDLARFLGILTGVVQAANLIILPFLSGRLLGRYGLKFGLIVAPVVIGGGTVLLVGAGTAFGVAGLFFWVLAATKLADGVLRNSLYGPAYEILYQPLPDAKRTGLRSLVEAILNPVVGGIAGGVLLVFSMIESLTLVHLSGALLLILAGWIISSLGLCQDYTKALMEALSKRILKGEALSLTDASSIQVLRDRLASPHPGEVIYSLNMLESVEHESFHSFLMEGLGHPSDDVRLHVLEKLGALKVGSALSEIRARIEVEDSPEVKAAALGVFCELAELEDVEEVSRYIDDPHPLVRKGTMVGLLRTGGVEQVLLAGRRLVEMEASSSPSERQLVAEVLRDLGTDRFYSPLLKLLRDDDPGVRVAAIDAAGKVKHPKLWALVLENLISPDCRRAASAALIEGGETALPLLSAAFEEAGQPGDVVARIARICGRIGTASAVDLLRENVAHHDKDVRDQVLSSLTLCGYRVGDGDSRTVQETMESEVSDATWAIRRMGDLPDDERLGVLRDALREEVDQGCDRIFSLLSFLYGAESVLDVRVKLDKGSDEEKAYAVELLDTLVSQEMKASLLPFLESVSESDSIEAEPSAGGSEPVSDLLTQEEVRLKPWTRACALYGAAQLARTELAGAAAGALSDPDPIVRETSLWALGRLDPEGAKAHVRSLQGDPGFDANRLIGETEAREHGDSAMLLTIEKVLVLKTVSMFSEIPDEVLGKVANVLEEADFAAGEAVFEKGDVGDCMYIIVEGQVRIHDGERTIGELGPREVFGDMAVLDAEPRSASATASEDSQLLRLSQIVFYELMSDHVVIARAISRMLSRRLREAVG